MPAKTDVSLLIPELADWNNGAGISVSSWLGCVGNFDLAIAFSQLFWPKFVEHDECVLRDDFSIESYEIFLRAYRGNRASVEAVMNHQHIQDLFSIGKKSTDGQLVYLGRVLKEILAIKLSRDFPDRIFNVEFDEGPFEDLVQYQITFWQSANLSRPGEP